MEGIQHVWNIAAGICWYAFLNARLRHIGDKRAHNVLGAFVVAGIVSVGLAFLLYEAYPPFVDGFFGQGPWLYHVGIVGVVEEAAKFLAFLFAVAAAGGIKEPQDGVIYGAIVGMTFGTVENILYIRSFDTWFMFVRPVLSTGGHAVYGAIWGGLYARSVYANTIGDDPGARLAALIGVPLVALFHGTYNALTPFLPAAILTDLVCLVIAVALYRQLVELSPYRIYPLSMARVAVTSIRRGLVFNPRSPLLNRNLGLYLMHLGKYRGASECLRASVPRSRDPRRAQFLAACCELTFLPGYYAKRAMRIAWSRLGDTQRASYLGQLEELVGDRDGVLDRVHAFIESAFKARKLRTTREIARDHKIRRLERKYGKPGESVAQAIERLDDDERARLARRMRGETQA